MIYKIKFNEDYSDFESWEKLESKYAKPQDYCKDHGDNKFLFVQKQKKEKTYIVVYHREGNGWARLPWKPKTWIKEYTPWNSMTEEQWIAAVKNFIPELNVTEKQEQTIITDRENTENVNISSQPTSVPPKKQKKGKASTPEISLEESKKIINENFKKLQTAYRAKYKKDFLKSEDFKMFFRKEDLDKILGWNKNASSKDDLIDLCSFYELKIGNPETADLVILGNNPGSKGEFKEILNFEGLFAEMEERKVNQNIFYPISSPEAMQLRPWFPNRLIYGVGGTTWKNRQEKNGVLYPFMENKNIASLCKYAKKTATLEMVPYHTKTFASGESFLDYFDLFDPAPIEKAMKNGAVIIALFRNAAVRWSSRVPKLQTYPYFYVNHKKEVNDHAEANASLSKQSLRRYSEFDDSINKRGERYPEFDAYSEIVKTLKEKKNW